MYMIYLFSNTLFSQINKSVYSLIKKLISVYSFEVYLYKYAYKYLLLGNSKRHNVLHREQFSS